MRVRAALQLVMAVTGLIAVSPAAVAAQVTWLGVFGHAPTAYNLSPPTTVTDRDGNPHTVQAGYAPLPPYRAETTVREIVRSSAAARSIRIRFSNEFANKALRIGEAHLALASPVAIMC
jgi:hypothetical protein